MHTPNSPRNHSKDQLNDAQLLQALERKDFVTFSGLAKNAAMHAGMIQEWSVAENQQIDTHVQLWLASAGKINHFMVNTAAKGQRPEIAKILQHAMMLVNHAKGLKEVSDTQSKTHDAFGKTGV